MQISKSSASAQLQPYTLGQYVSAGCYQVVKDGKPDVIGIAVHGMTKGLMCNGCAYASGCDAKAKLNGVVRVRSQRIAVSETTRQEAERRGLSISEVRRLRAAANAAVAQGE